MVRIWLIWGSIVACSLSMSVGARANGGEVAFTVLACPKAENLRPTITITDQSTRQTTLVKPEQRDGLGLWHAHSPFKPGTYWIDGRVYKPGLRAGSRPAVFCSAFTSITILPGGGREMFLTLVEPHLIGGEFCHRSIYGYLPLPHMRVTLKAEDEPGSQERNVTVDGRIFDAGELCAHDYQVRVYPPDSNEYYMEFTAALRVSGQLAHFQHNVTFDEFVSGLRSQYKIP